MSRRNRILLLVLGALVLGTGFWLLNWLALPAQAETLGVGWREGAIRRALRKRITAYLEAVRRGDEDRAMEFWRICGVFQGGQEPLYWRRIAVPQVKELP